MQKGFVMETRPEWEAGNPNQYVKISVASLYDTQKLRIQVGNRICRSMAAKLGIFVKTNKEIVDEKESAENERKKQDVLKLVYDDFLNIIDGKNRRWRDILEEDLVTDKIVDQFVYEKWKKLKPGKIITDFTEFMLVQNYHNLRHNEKICTDALKTILEENSPFYKSYLKNVKGVGPAMAGSILSCVNIYKADTVARLWAFAGFDTVKCINKNGKTIIEGRGRKEQHLVPRKYIDKNGELKSVNCIKYNTFLKTKLVVLAASFIKCNSPYKKIYDNYKFRLMNQERFKDNPNKLHIHKMAVRYMIKRFLADMWVAWRKFENLEVTEEYSVRKLGMIHHE